LLTEVWGVEAWRITTPDGAPRLQWV